MRADDQPYHIRNVGSGLLLEVCEGRAADGVRVQQGRQAESGGSAGQLWWITPVFEGSALHHVVSVASGRQLEVAAASRESGVPVRQWQPSDCAAQEWLLEEHVAKPGTYSMVSYVSGLLLEVAEGAREEGARVRQGHDADSPHQWWTLEPVPHAGRAGPAGGAGRAVRVGRAGG